MRLDSDATPTSSQSHGQKNERLRAEYQKAVRANAAAKRRYDEVASQTPPVPKDLNLRRSTRAMLDQRLELLEQQNHHAKLIGLKDQLEAVNVSGLAVVNLDSRMDEIVQGTVHPETAVEGLAGSISSSIETLELALVQAHHEARREKTSLERLKASATDQATKTAEEQSYAMLAVRKELTAWLEQNLDQCQEENSAPEGDRELEAANDDQDWECKIDSQYEQYLEARRRLLIAVAESKTPLPSGEPKTTNGERGSEEHRYRSPQSSKIADMEKALLPGMQQERLLQTYSTFATEQLRNDVTTTTNLLDRLSDESQLLQAFPLLSRSEGFAKARSTFGQKRNIAQNKEKDEVMERLEPWLFAAEAADIASTDAAEKHLHHANESLETVSRSLLELQLLQETRP